MLTTMGWHEIALRLALTVVAAAVIGTDRSKHGHTAGLRVVAPGAHTPPKLQRTRSRSPSFLVIVLGSRTLRLSRHGGPGGLERARAPGEPTAFSCSWRW